MALASAAGGCATGENDAGGDPAAGLPDAAPAVDAMALPDAAPAPDGPALPPDAAPPPPDAALPPPDAAPPPPDAAPSPPDAAPPPDACVPTALELLSNPSFDDGPGGGWVETSSAGVNLVLDQSQTPVDAHTPNHLVWLGGYLEDSESGISGIDLLRQDIALPPDATGFSITGFRIIGTEEPNDDGNHYDTLTVSIRDPATDAVLETLNDPSVSTCTSFYGGPCTWSNLHESGTYQGFTLTPAGDYAGQTIRVELRSDVDIVFNTNFFVDTLQAQVTACP